MKRRRAKTMDDLVGDPRALYHVGQLIGCAEMLSWWLRGQKEEELQRMGDKLAEATAWFFTSDKQEDKWSRAPAYPPKTES